MFSLIRINSWMRFVVSKVGFFKFLLRKTGELVDSHSIGLIWLGIVLIDLFDVLREYFVSVFIISRRCTEAPSSLFLPLLVELASRINRGSAEHGVGSKRSEQGQNSQSGTFHKIFLYE